ncbi:AAA family ATPase, partial [Candidatus Bathyarchaeota archaeon]
MSSQAHKRKPEIQLRVADARQRDVGRGIARINQKAMKAVGVSTGDVIEIEGTKKTAAIAWPAYIDDQDEDIIRIDGITRENAGVSLNDYVIVRKADVRNATSITIAPTDVRFREVEREIEVFLRNRLVNRPVVEGDIVRVPYAYRPLTFTIVRTRPKGVVRITYNTRLKLLPEPVEGVKVPRVTYEDIGDLEEAIQKIR